MEYSDCFEFSVRTLNFRIGDGSRISEWRLRVTNNQGVLHKAARHITATCMTTVRCKISEKLNNQLEATARRRRVSKSAILREALESKTKGWQGPRSPHMISSSISAEACAGRKISQRIQDR
ncbi:MAG: hypothetical protein DME32_16915 [Verrucomicrobia bacterium]|nr:MAG: hypothetical protein DME32_16915 [Verrucomicrobiota bacterium]